MTRVCPAAAVESGVPEGGWGLPEARGQGPGAGEGHRGSAPLHPQLPALVHTPGRGGGVLCSGASKPRSKCLPGCVPSAGSGEACRLLPPVLAECCPCSCAADGCPRGCTAQRRRPSLPRVPPPPSQQQRIPPVVGGSPPGCVPLGDTSSRSQSHASPSSWMVQACSWGRLTTLLP